jgi:orotate phosphoribosyltransferase
MLHLDEAGWIARLTADGAFWLHDGNPKRPHALLTSGGHSNGFFNGSKVIENPVVLGWAMRDLLDKLGRLPIKKSDNLWVIGSALGACDLSYELGRQMQCHRGFTEPAEVDGAKTMLLKRFTLPKGTPVLLVEDVFTTGGTTAQTKIAVEQGGGIVLPVIGVLCNRSGKKELAGCRVVALIEREMTTWDPAHCRLCSLGSEAVRPKANWDKLTAEY